MQKYIYKLYKKSNSQINNHKIYLRLITNLKKIFPIFLLKKINLTSGSHIKNKFDFTKQHDLQ